MGGLTAGPSALRFSWPCSGGNGLSPRRNAFAPLRFQSERKKERSQVTGILQVIVLFIFSGHEAPITFPHWFKITNQTLAIFTSTLVLHSFTVMEKLKI